MFGYTRFILIIALNSLSCKASVFSVVSGGGWHHQSTVSRLLKYHNNISVAELCQGEDAGDHVPVIPGGDIPELQ